MTELYFVVEGQTEEKFVNRCLIPHLYDFNVFGTARIIPTSRDQRTSQIHGRGGGFFKTWKRELKLHLGSDHRSDIRFTTLFDLYGLPQDFPHYEDILLTSDTVKRAGTVEKIFAEEFGDRRLIPYFQRHEFEALLFAGLPTLRRILDDETDLLGLDRLASEVAGLAPEDINDGPETAPSKRLLSAVPSYNKTLYGPLVANEIGLSTLRSSCPRFSKWISTLESLGQP